MMLMMLNSIAFIAIKNMWGFFISYKVSLMVTTTLKVNIN